MASTSISDIDLHPKDIKYLFLDPELNPFENERLQISGAEEAANYLRTKKRKDIKIRLNIFLPPGQIDSDTQNRTKNALERYCDFKISQNQHQLEIGWAEGWRSVMIGLCFSALCLFFALIIRFFGILTDAGLIVSTGFFTILIWMAIWNPAETFLYGLPPHKLEIRYYKVLKDAEIVIKEEI
jgi:hypothetical protein